MMKFPFFRSSRARQSAAPNTDPLSANLPACGDPVLVRPDLAVYPLLRPDRGDVAPAYVSLAEALQTGRARLHETDGLRETEVENLTETDLFIGAGETVRGGWQDWTLGVDLVVPRRSQRRRLSLREFCLRPGRWHFCDRREVSRAFAEVGAPAAGAEGASPDPHGGRLGGAEVSGFAYALGGVPRGAHLYATPALFAQLWPGLLEHVLAEAGGASSVPANAAGTPPPGAAEMRDWLAGACLSAGAEAGAAHPVTPRVTLVVREVLATATPGRGERLVCLETLDAGRGGACVHRALVPAASVR